MQRSNPSFPPRKHDCSLPPRFRGLAMTSLRSREKYQTACKPGSVRPLPGGAAIPLGRALPRASCGQPEPQGGNAPGARGCPRRRRFLFGLAPGGVYPASAVTGAAVRSCRTVSPLPRAPGGLRGGLFSVALSLGSPPPAVSRHRFPWSPDFPLSRFWRNSGRPAVWWIRRCAYGQATSSSAGFFRDFFQFF